MDLAGDTQVHVEAGISSCRKRNGDVSSHRDTPHIVNNESALEQELQVIGGLEDNTQAEAEESSFTPSENSNNVNRDGNLDLTRESVATESSILQESKDHRLFRTSSNAGYDASPIRTISHTSRKDLRVSFEGNSPAQQRANLVRASAIPLSTPAASFVVSDDVPVATQYAPKEQLLNQLEELPTSSVNINPARTSLQPNGEQQTGPYESNPAGNTLDIPQLVHHSGRSSVENPIRGLSAGWSAESVSADQVSLPDSGISSNMSDHLDSGLRTSPVIPLGCSLEQLRTRPENIVQSTQKKKDGFLSWIAGPQAARAKRKDQNNLNALLPHPQQISRTAPETDDYRESVHELASHFPTFKNVAATKTRHQWSSRIVFYDHIRDAQSQNPSRHEPWENSVYQPSYLDFRDKLRNVPEKCTQRLVLIEDLTPALIDLLGATFQIPPHVFEEHLERSGYTGVWERQHDATQWHTRPSAHGYSSVTWYRPVLPLVPLTSKFQAKLISDGVLPQVRCPIEGCKPHSLWLDTLANTWRHQLDLCPEPGVYYKNSQTKYPVGWEERATIWTRDVSGCKFVILLLDPLPMVAVEEQEGVTTRAQRRREVPTIAHLWFRQQELASRARKARQAQNETQRRRDVYDWIEETLVPQEPMGHFSTGGMASTRNRQPQSNQDPISLREGRTRVTGADANDPNSDFAPAALRRRATKPVKNRQRSTTRNFQPSPPLSDQQSQEVEGGNTRAIDIENHQPFVLYEPIKARASSTTWTDDTVTTQHMSAYIDSLQNPKSTLDEFDHFLMSPSRGRNRTYDPFQALFHTIHDDSNSLVDIIRTSMQRIREGTLDEEFMQKRVRFWRSLLHRLGFHLGVLEQSLREFEQFVFESEAHTAQVETMSQTLSKDTQRTLRGCMDLIDRSSHSLLAEMQIADSRRGIAEAESVSKLTELAFVFIPLSFVASLFSMQIHELDGGVPLYQFVLVAIGLVIGAYTVRLSIRSSNLIEYRDALMRQIHEDSGLQPNEKLPTHKFVSWVGVNVGSTLLKNSRNAAAIVTPLVMVLAIVAGLLSPVILLWQRTINTGFSIAITVLILLLDAMLVVPVAVNMSNAGMISFDPRSRILKIQHAHEKNRKIRQRNKRRRRREAGLDPEAPWEDSTDNSSISASGNGERS